MSDIGKHKISAAISEKMLKVIMTMQLERNSEFQPEIVEINGAIGELSERNCIGEKVFIIVDSESTLAALSS